MAKRALGNYNFQDVSDAAGGGGGSGYLGLLDVSLTIGPQGRSGSILFASADLAQWFLFWIPWEWCVYLVFLTELDTFKPFSAEFVFDCWVLTGKTGEAVGKRLIIMYLAGLPFKGGKFPVLLLPVTHYATVDKFFSHLCISPVLPLSLICQPA